MDEFDHNLKELISSFKKNVHASKSDTEYALDNARILNPVLKIVYEKFEESVNIINKEFGFPVLFIEELSVEILKLLLNFEDTNSCFFLRSKHKLVFVFDEGFNQITLFGKYVSFKDQKIKANQKFVQLFKLNTRKADDKIEFKDNTGTTIDVEEVVLQVIKWVVSSN